MEITASRTLSCWRMADDLVYSQRRLTSMALPWRCSVSFLYNLCLQWFCGISFTKQTGLFMDGRFGFIPCTRFFFARGHRLCHVKECARRRQSAWCVTVNCVVDIYKIIFFKNWLWDLTLLCWLHLAQNKNFLMGTVSSKHFWSGVVVFGKGLRLILQSQNAGMTGRPSWRYQI